jgi:cytochrome c oxidase cbb3-type subunit 3
VLLACAEVIGGCQPEKRHIGPEAPVTAPTGLRDVRAQLYETNRYQMSEGARLFRWQGCDGCHTDPAPGFLDLADTSWRRGGATPQIYRSIAEGAPGMPAFGPRLTPQQIWQIAGYLHDLHTVKPAQRRRNADALQGEPSGATWRGPLP